MYGYIYRITDLTNGKCYIGQHKYDKPMLDPKYHGSSCILKNQIKKHPENFLEDLIFIAATLDELNYFETYFIEHLNTLHPNGYNLNTGGDQRSASDEFKSKMRAIQTGKPRSEETKKKISDSLKGHKRSEETRQKMSDAQKGKNVSEETRQKMSDAQKGKRCGEESAQYKYHITKEELYDLYIVQGLYQYQIAEIYGCHQTTILHKLKKYNITK